MSTTTPTAATVKNIKRRLLRVRTLRGYDNALDALAEVLKTARDQDVYDAAIAVGVEVREKWNTETLTFSRMAPKSVAEVTAEAASPEKVHYVASTGWSGVAGPFTPAEAAEYARDHSGFILDADQVDPEIRAEREKPEPKKVNLRSRMIENTADRQVYTVTDGDLEAQVETIDGTFHIYFPNPSAGTAEVQPGEECLTLAEAQAHLAGWFAAHYARTA